MKNDTELKLYETLGVKKFKNLIFTFRDIKWRLFTFEMSPEERHSFLYDHHNSYNIGLINNYNDIKKYKNNIYINSCIHLYSLTFCIMNILLSESSPYLVTRDSAVIIMNLYYLMLQRYNNIRLNRVIEKVENHNKLYGTVENKEELLDIIHKFISDELRYYKESASSFVAYEKKLIRK